MDSAMMFQDALATLPLTVLRVLGWLLLGFAIAQACGVVAVITSFEIEHRRAAKH